MGFNPLKDLINLSPNLMKIAGEGEKCCYLERHMGFADVLDPHRAPDLLARLICAIKRYKVLNSCKLEPLFFKHGHLLIDY